MAKLEYRSARGSTIHSVPGVSSAEKIFYACNRDGLCAYCEDFESAKDYVELLEIGDPSASQQGRRPFPRRRSR